MSNGHLKIGNENTNDIGNEINNAIVFELLLFIIILHKLFRASIVERST
jgi:hypothetical protein